VPEPVARPWLELRLKAEKAAATLDETVVHFELEIENSGTSAARNLRIAAIVRVFTVPTGIPISSAIRACV